MQRITSKARRDSGVNVKFIIVTSVGSTEPLDTLVKIDRIFHCYIDDGSTKMVLFNNSGNGLLNIWVKEKPAHIYNMLK